LPDLNHVTWALREIASGEYDIVHAHSAAALACGRFLPELPLVYTIHHEREAQLSAFYAHFRQIQYVAISDDQRRREIPLPRVTVIHHGLDTSRYEWTSRPGDYVAFMGRFAEVKGPDIAIDVARRARVPIIIAGQTNPPDRAWAERALTRRLSARHARFLGSIGDSLKAPLLRDARALLAPIQWNEPFGLVLIEAMLSGCPVVAFKRGSVGEIVEEGVTGFVAESADHMAEIIRRGGPLDDFDRKRCRLRAVERFSRERMTTDHVRLYERMLAGRTESRSAVAIREPVGS
jgi:glycosyltransferase involved in cell wall biosynthesis